MQPTKLSKRTILTAAIILLMIPATIVVSMLWFDDDRQFYITSLVIIIFAMLPFAMAFEGRKPQARELVLLAVMVAIGVVGRAAFFMIPQFKPVLAIVIISGVALGARSGFVVGALTAFVSNFIFGQGMWTPWQMFALGLIGFLAGLLFNKGPLPQKRLPLCIFGALAALIIYGLILDTSAIALLAADLSPEAVFTVYLMGLPFNSIHAGATVVFLAVLSSPMLEKLTRVKQKYGLLP